MNTAELIARVRRNVFMTSATHPDYTDAVIIDELNDQLFTLFERAIVETRSGYWVQTQDYTVTSGVSSYRLPPRACGFEKVEIGYGSPAAYSRLPEASEAHARLWEGSAGMLGAPQAYVLRGDQLVLLPTPDNSTYTIRVYYYIRPSRLVLPQSTGVGGVGGTVRGQITNVVGNVITVSNLPFDQELASPVAITSGLQQIDVVKANGWHELAVVGVNQTNNGTTSITVPTGTDLSEVDFAAGKDYVRAAEQTDWPCLPDDFHRCLADAVSVKIMTQLNMAAKAGQLAASVSADLQRFQSLISTRVKSEPRTIRAPLPALRGLLSYPGRWS